MQPPDHIGYWLSLAVRTVRAAASDILRAHCIERGKPYIVTPPQWGVRNALAANGEQTVGACSQLMAVETPAISGIVTRLEQIGLVDRVHDPKLVYLDEPTLGVDVQARRAIWDYILALRDQGKTVLATTNYLEEAEALCDRIAIIDHGRLVALDTPTELTQRFGGSVVEMETVRLFQDLEQLRAMPGIQEVEQAGLHLTVHTQSGKTVVPQIINLT
jgi:hypothetical protein